MQLQRSAKTSFLCAKTAQTNFIGQRLHDKNYNFIYENDKLAF